MNFKNIYRWFKLDISRRTDILAFTAFLIALTGLIYQLFNYIKGPDLKLFPPQVVLLFSHKLPNFVGDEIVRVNAVMTYVNQGQIGYNGVVKRESVTFDIGDEKFTYNWLNFESYTLEDSMIVKNAKGDDARPFVVNAGSGHSHTTSFTPMLVRDGSDSVKYKNFLSWEEFIDMIKDVNKIEFQFISETYEGELERSMCWIELDNHLKENLEKNRWGSTECVESQIHL